MKMFRIIIMLTILMMSVSGVFASDRDDVITKEMDRLQYFNETAEIADTICWDDVCAMPGDHRYGIRQEPIENSETLGYSFYDDWVVLTGSRNDLEIGAEWFDYTYREEGLMKLDGTMTGIYVDYSHRFSSDESDESDEKWINALFSPSRISMLSFQARYSAGNDIHYRSEGSGEHEDEKHSSWEMRALLGHNVPLSNKDIQMVPYLGIGYRYLLDDNGGTQTTTGAWGYDRESKYWYVPVGLDITRKIKNGWSIGLNMEYDLFLVGKQTSHLEDVAGYTEPLVNDQDEGYGLRGSINVVKEYEMIDIIFEPFTRYWHIKDSVTSCSVDTCGLEPNNRTWEFGARAGIRF